MIDVGNVHVTMGKIETGRKLLPGSVTNMKPNVIGVLFVVLCRSGGAGATGIPEPDAVLYGTALENGAAIQQQGDVSIVVRTASGQELGRYDFFDCNANGVRDECELSCSAPSCSGTPGCGTARDSEPVDGLLDDCPGHLYVLRIRCESVPEGLTPGGGAVVLDPSDPPVVQIYIHGANGPERFVRDFTVSERGQIANLTVRPPDVTAVSELAACLGGPTQSSPPAKCAGVEFATADYDENHHVDLRDYARLQNAAGRD